MKQKLALSCALIHKPAVLFLDEPTTGVDPVSRKEFWGMLKNLKKKGITILVSTPYMDEASLCDRIGLIQNGSFLTIDTPEEIIAGFGQRLWAAHSKNMNKLLTDLRSNANVKSSFAFGDSIHITLNEDYKTEQLRHELEAKGHTGISIRTIKPGIEDCFMELSKEGVRE
jgi:ABC-type multidrug transport system ATPase subunit